MQISIPCVALGLGSQHMGICQAPGVMRILPKKPFLQQGCSDRSRLAADCPSGMEELSISEATLHRAENCTSPRLTASHPGVQPGFDAS